MSGSRIFSVRRLAIVAAAAMAVSGAANAAPVAVSPGQSLVLTETNSGANNSGSPSTNDFSDLTGLVGAGSYNYANGFTSNQTGLNFANTNFGFYDDFVFTVGPNQLNSITSTISLGNSLGISSLQVRLYDYTANNGAVPLLTTPVPGSAFQAWSTVINLNQVGTGTYAVLSPITLGAGTYVIEVRGTATGSGGGSYAGVLNVTPVPLPAALPLFLSGLGLFGAAMRGAGPQCAAIWSSSPVPCGIPCNPSGARSAGSSSAGTSAIPRA
jgi:hypothetical protein